MRLVQLLLLQLIRKTSNFFLVCAATILIGDSNFATLSSAPPFTGKALVALHMISLGKSSFCATGAGVPDQL